jgi:SAM-dependent methyltransferase
MIGSIPRQATKLLAHAGVWCGFRRLLDWSWGLYRKRFRLLQEWGLTREDLSVLDVGCGSGEYAQVFQGTYTGIDLSPRYVAAASMRYPLPGKAFRCADVASLSSERQTYDVVILVDFLHHFPDAAAIEILSSAARLARRYVVSLEPLSNQRNLWGRCLVRMDRGRYMRPRESVSSLLRAAGLSVDRENELYLGPIRTWAWLCPGLGGSVRSPASRKEQ